MLTEHKGNDLIIDAFDPCYEIGQGNECAVDTVYRLNVTNVEKQIFSIRKFGTYFLQKRKVSTVAQLVKNNNYDLVNFHFIPINVLEMVKACKRYNAKVMLTPLGSDVLRVNGRYRNNIKRAFSLADYVSFNTNIGFCKEVSHAYGISANKIVNLGYGSEVISSILELKGKYSRKEYSSIASIPNSKFNIVCGYNASLAQRQNVILKSLIENKQFLPEGYQIIIPLSYGNDKEVIKRDILSLNENHKLNICFLDYYLSNEQVASLRLITDLFIHIQTTDAYNASLQEFLLTGTTCINGAWLKYPSLERNGAPYIICKDLDHLSDCLKNCICNPSPVFIHDNTISEIVSNSWINRIKDWLSFFNEM